MISDCLQDCIEEADIVPSIKSDHSAITLQINSIEDKVHGPSHWIFNSSLLDDDNYVNLITSRCQDWLIEFQDVDDKRLLWDLVKYRIRQNTISYSKTKTKRRKNKLVDLENRLQRSEELCACHPTEQNKLDLEKFKGEYDSMYDYITRGGIVRYKATWYEKGERNNKYFLGLEKSRNKKNCIRKLVNKHGQTVTKSEAIMTELRSFYEDLYDNKDSGVDNDDLQFLDQSLNVPKLSNKLSLLCDGLLTYTECYEALEKFDNNKSPGNDGLTSEFYKTFWPTLGNLLVHYLNAAYINGKLSNSQGQAIIRLIEKKDKDRR